MTRPAVLCVDDEPNLLRGLTLHMRRHFEVTTTTEPKDALQKLTEAPSQFAVVVSDLRMPGMDGVTLLRHASEVAPDTSRVLLTGHADLNAMKDGINEAHIYHFLTKPCPPGRLLGTLRTACEHHRLVRAERELLEDTLRGCVQTLTSVLSVAQPTAFGKAQRAQALVRELATATGQPTSWLVEVAAMLSQLGAIALPRGTTARLHAGEPLDEREKLMVARLPKVVDQLVAPIPRLEEVREILALVSRRFDRHDSLPWGARALRIALDFDELESQGVEEDLALQTMRSRTGVHDPKLLARFAELRGGDERRLTVQEIGLWQVAVGMRFLVDVRLANGSLLIARGHVATPGIIERIRNLPSEISQLDVKVSFDPELEPLTRDDQPDEASALPT